MIPTTIDTKEYYPIRKKTRDKICIGWSGSVTTIPHLKTQMEALRQIKKKYSEKVYFKIIGDANFYDDELDVKGLAWKKEKEIEELSEFDIGIMPLPDSEWAKGKCGLKGLQYMSLEIPTIMSPVGVNSEIIIDGENGFLADSTNEWVSKLSLLIESEALRKELGIKGRQTVLNKYSVEANKQLYLKYFNSLLSEE
jgi:glycosyltransferase involved in cell wall biosynthesis